MTNLFCLYDVVRKTLHCACATMEKSYYDVFLAYPAVKVNILRFKQVSIAKVFVAGKYLHFLQFPNIPIIKSHVYLKSMYLNKLGKLADPSALLASMEVNYHLIGLEGSLC